MPCAQPNVSLAAYCSRCWDDEPRPRATHVDTRTGLPVCESCARRASAVSYGQVEAALLMLGTVVQVAQDAGMTPDEIHAAIDDALTDAPRTWPNLPMPAWATGALERDDRFERIDGPPEATG